MRIRKLTLGIVTCPCICWKQLSWYVVLNTADCSGVPATFLSRRRDQYIYLSFFKVFWPATADNERMWALFIIDSGWSVSNTGVKAWKKEKFSFKRYASHGLEWNMQQLVFYILQRTMQRKKYQALNSITYLQNRVQLFIIKTMAYKIQMIFQVHLKLKGYHLWFTIKGSKMATKVQTSMKSWVDSRAIGDNIMSTSFLSLITTVVRVVLASHTPPTIS